MLCHIIPVKIILCVLKAEGTGGGELCCKRIEWIEGQWVAHVREGEVEGASWGGQRRKENYKYIPLFFSSFRGFFFFGR